MVLVSTQASAQSMLWEMHNAAGEEAYEQARYPEAEKAWLGALKEAESFGSEDPRLADSLNNLAMLYHTQGKYAEAEPLYQRLLAIREKALGPEHPDVATSLNNLADLYRAQGKYAEAEPLYQRLLAISEKTVPSSITVEAHGGVDHTNGLIGLALMTLSVVGLLILLVVIIRHCFKGSLLALRIALGGVAAFEVFMVHGWLTAVTADEFYGMPLDIFAILSPIIIPVYIGMMLLGVVLMIWLVRAMTTLP